MAHSKIRTLELQWAKPSAGYSSRPLVDKREPISFVGPVPRLDGKSSQILDECGRNGGKPLSGGALSRFLPWNASPEDLLTWAQPPPNDKTPDQ
jgi:hypothetical protein